MSERTAISWADSTFNPWIGCTKVSPACDHCYAERLMDHRMHKVEWGSGKPRVRTSMPNWGQPLTWNAQPFCECMGCGWRGEQRKAEVKDRPPGFDRDPGAVSMCPRCAEPLLKEARRRVFCASLADVFDKEAPEAWRFDLLNLIADTPSLDWLLLTKRIGNARAMLDAFCESDGHKGEKWDAWPNVWLGITVVNQEEADREISKLDATPAAVRFLSVEPMLGPIQIGHEWLWGEGSRNGIDWVICGGESGPNARPMHPDWVRSLRDQCATAGVPFHFKQWGEWVPYEHSAQPPFLWSQHGHEIDGHALPDFESDDGRAQREWHCDYVDQILARRVGAARAGRLLDGLEHNGAPA